jgi:hypothetical protein
VEAQEGALRIGGAAVEIGAAQARIAGQVVDIAHREVEVGQVGESLIRGAQGLDHRLFLF